MGFLKNAISSFASANPIGAAISGGVSLLGGLFGNKSQSQNIDKQIAAQKEENQKNREYNLMLAQQQNQWNQEQWERENDYNTPEAQMERLKQAGLNPDLAYGGQNIAASSPMMTSGAPSNPTDMTALGQKPTLGQAIQSALRDSMIGAQIENIKADTEKKKEEAKGQNISNEFQELANALDLDAKQLANNLSAQQAEQAEELFKIIQEDVKIKKETLKGVKLDNIRKDIENEFKKPELKAILKKLENDANLSENDAKFAIESYSLRMLGLETETNADFVNWLNENGASDFSTLLRGIRYVLQSLGK